MYETSARLLRLLSLFQVRRSWSGPELSERLEVSDRTVRADIEKLRSLGYPVQATPGVAGGYRLGPGVRMPPLMLDDDEAIAVALGLQTATSGAVEGVEESSLRALAKLEQLLPDRLRRRVKALNSHTTSIRLDAPWPTITSDTLAVLSLACRDHERVRFSYVSHTGDRSARSAEPYRLVRWGQRWYLVAWDLFRSDWRTFRVDRIDNCRPVGARFTPRDLPDDDLAAYVTRQVSVAPRRHQATLILHAPVETMRARLNDAVGSLEVVDDQRCTLRTAHDSLEVLAVYIGLLGVDFEVLEPPELIEYLRRVAARYRLATGDS